MNRALGVLVVILAIEWAGLAIYRFFEVRQIFL